MLWCGRKSAVNGRRMDLFWAKHKGRRRLCLHLVADLQMYKMRGSGGLCTNWTLIMWPPIQYVCLLKTDKIFNILTGHSIISPFSGSNWWHQILHCFKYGCISAVDHKLNCFAGGEWENFQRAMLPTNSLKEEWGIREKVTCIVTKAAANTHGPWTCTEFSH